jgi:hypothetical protein
MTSLFIAAIDCLEAHFKDAYDRWENAAQAGTDPVAQRVTENIRAESHFLDPIDARRETAFSGFLRELGTRHLGGVVAHLSFEATVLNYQLNGETVRFVGNPLFRFVPLRTIATRVAQAVNEIALLNDIGADAYIRLMLVAWESSGRDRFAKIELGPPGKPVWVTFADAEGRLVASLASASMITDMLGIPRPRPDPLLLLKYDPSSSQVRVKYPTCADAGWSSRYRASRAEDAHGWTEPLSNPSERGFPEGVHANASGSLLQERPEIIL